MYPQSLELFKTYVGKALCNLIWYHHWPWFQQEVELEASTGPFQPKLSYELTTLTFNIKWNFSVTLLRNKSSFTPPADNPGNWIEFSVHIQLQSLKQSIQKFRRTFFIHERHFNPLFHAFLLQNTLRISRRKALAVTSHLLNVYTNMPLETVDQWLAEESPRSTLLASEWLKIHKALRRPSGCK